ncbi:MAG: hypothetical protein U0W40_08650 [Acidimicrobiia bacterium]
MHVSWSPWPYALANLLSAAVVVFALVCAWRVLAHGPKRGWQMFFLVGITGFSMFIAGICVPLGAIGILAAATASPRARRLVRDPNGGQPV